jgi:hypothetical protein
MHSDWTVACGADDPMIVVPWTGEDESLRYIDLRESPARVEEIPEAAQHAALASALLRWNQPDSPIFTAKCDVWEYGAEHFDAEDLPEFSCAHACYIDLFPGSQNVFSSFKASEQVLRKWNALAHSIPFTEARCEWTLRPARIVSPAARIPAQKYADGFATTLYVWGYGMSSDDAIGNWSTALLGLIDPLLSGKP